MSGLMDDKTIAEVGKIHGVQAIVTRSVIKFGQLISITVKLIDTETVKLIDSADLKTSNVNDIPSMIEELAMDLADES